MDMNACVRDVTVAYGDLGFLTGDQRGSNPHVTNLFPSGSALKLYQR